MGYPFLTINFDLKLSGIDRYSEWKKRFDSTANTLKFVATGSEGGATGFFSRTLKNAGFNCAHEHLFFFRNPWNPPYYGGCSWYLAPFFQIHCLVNSRGCIY